MLLKHVLFLLFSPLLLALRVCVWRFFSSSSDSSHVQKLILNLVIPSVDVVAYLRRFNILYFRSTQLCRCHFSVVTTATATAVSVLKSHTNFYYIRLNACQVNEESFIVNLSRSHHFTTTIRQWMQDT